MKKKIIAYLFILPIIICITGCNENIKPASTPDKLTIAVSIIPQATFVEKVAGELVDIVTLIPPGYSPTNYQPTPKLMKEFSKSLIYFTIGVPTEESNILPKVRSINKNIQIVDLAKDVAKFYHHRYFDETEHSHDDGHEHKGHDPHIWLSPKRVKVMIDRIATELSTVDAKNKEIYQKNAESFKLELDELDQEIEDKLSHVSNKSFIIYHPSLGYFADDYGLKMYALEENGKDSTPQNLQSLIDLALEENIKVVFYQAEVDSRQSKTLAEEIGARTVMLDPLSPDYINNMKKITQAILDSVGGN